MSDIVLDRSQISQFVSEDEIKAMGDEVLESHRKIVDRTGAGSEMLDWVELPNNIDEAEFSRMQKAADKIRSDSEVFVVIGIGGSYLGAQAVIEALKPNFYNNLRKEQRGCPEIYYVGNNFSGSYLADLFEVIKDKDVSINVVSKSGTTTESAVAFRIFKNYLEEKYGAEEARGRIYVTTDREKGALKAFSDKQGYETFIIKDGAGGRYSVLTPVGLLPIAVAGIDIKELIRGASAGVKDYSKTNLMENPAYLYAAIRNILYRKGKKIEMLATYEPSLSNFAEWWKQLFGESEGKDGKGIFPAAVNLTKELHSLGQYIQDGERTLFETVINVGQAHADITIKIEESNFDSLDFLSDKTLNYVNNRALHATVIAHTDGEVPNIIINIPEMSPFYLGKLIYFFEKSCAISAYILGVNPFNQPGVEAYKNNMYALLGKPGYEDLKKELEKRI